MAYLILMLRLNVCLLRSIEAVMETLKCPVSADDSLALKLISWMSNKPPSPKLKSFLAISTPKLFTFRTPSKAAVAILRVYLKLTLH